MTTTTFLAVLLAAALHAGWNVMVKGGGDKALAMAAVVLGQGLFAIPALFFVPSPDPASYLYIAAGATLHLGYQFFLLASYRAGDLTQVYPLARGSAPVIVTLVSVLALGVTLAPMQLVAVAIIALGIMSLALVRRADGQRNRNAAWLALATGCFIAAYSLVDGLGARLAGTALGFYGWASVTNAIGFAAIIRFSHPGTLSKIAGSGKLLFIVGGFFSYAAYALVIWSFTQAPIALVTALRETSIIFALLLGVFVLREKLSLAKVASTMSVLVGVILLRFAKIQ